jgi:hypothetical protein
MADTVHLLLKDKIRLSWGRFINEARQNERK